MKLLLKGLELLLDITLLKRLKDHIDIKYVVPTEMVKKKDEKETELSDHTDSGSDIIEIPE